MEDNITIVDFYIYNAQMVSKFRLNDPNCHPHCKYTFDQLIEILEQRQEMKVHSNQQEWNMVGRTQNIRPV